MKFPSLRPTAEELVEAVREHIVSRLIPTIVEPQLRFQTLVAAHVLGVVGRELSGGSVAFRHLSKSRGELAGSPADDRMLCDAIRSGAFDDDDTALRLHLVERTELALLAWNPMFLQRVKNITP
jgi:hypothetical protein